MFGQRLFFTLFFTSFLFLTTACLESPLAQSGVGPGGSRHHENPGDDNFDADQDEDSFEVPRGKVRILVAQGDIGRTTLSCDGGKSWRHNRSWDSIQERDENEYFCGPCRCGGDCHVKKSTGCVVETNFDCGHSSGFAKGIAFGDGKFVATWGWGHKGKVMTSDDGVNWRSTLYRDPNNFKGAEYGQDTFVLASTSPYTSEDGESWSQQMRIPFGELHGINDWSVRAFGFVPYGGGHFMAYQSGDEQDFMVSSDQGVNWWRPDDLDACVFSGFGRAGIAFGNDTVVGVTSSGYACSSQKNSSGDWSPNEPWTRYEITPNSLAGYALFNPYLGESGKFLAWSNHSDRYTSDNSETDLGLRWGYNLYSSVDGKNWKRETLTRSLRSDGTKNTSGPGIAVTTIYPDEPGPLNMGVIVATNSHNSGGSYEGQSIRRSVDGGLSWETVPTKIDTGKKDSAGNPIMKVNFVKSHKIQDFAHGWAEASVCD